MNYAVISWAVVSDVFILHATAGRYKPEEWDAFVEDLRTLKYSKYLGTSTGSSEISSVQRKQVSEILAANNTQSAVVTDSRVVRGIVTAASWLGVNIRSFSWEEVEAAVGSFGLTGDRKAVVETLMAMKAKNDAVAGQ